MSSHGERYLSALRNKPLEPISRLAPYCGLIISTIFVILFFTRYHLLERCLIPRLYGRVYTDLSDLNRRGFINHHIAGATKAIILVLAIYPFVAVVSGRAAFRTPFAPGSRTTLGDMLIIAAQMLIAMYIFELIYRVRVSPVAMLHHIGTVLIGQAVIALSLGSSRKPHPNLEFVLCVMWGAFDIVFEMFPHVAIILYRIYPNDHRFLSRVFLFSCITTAVGTTCETIVIMFFLGCLWNKWLLAFKIAAPLLHCAFSAAQIHGSTVFWTMYKRQERLLNGEGARDAERGEMTERTEPKDDYGSPPNSSPSARPA
ncbi:hypothetical protein LOZ53_006876 [Ophidiomyces ophidiicola]|uniref:Uncharacterized protein n=1 Tax=Ophidiomyces ophidiicola TaxID=1387563 RepID=A0ACB8UZT9_9EURO|nr:uncharacterized protein LOZ57_000174 [Ophidiomyces ophidiicola]KAI1908589.1 hypothetical protein LOZ61_005444 [Ophidiomyces ophidiicola]KAI1910534.1 hypothetical protein LOZ64_004914 [Ophidiomyces ophidiicola]KAI1920445.1 hypothetical protein LOZ65_004045 [Ophidiomyces ophidiicola]KAI1923706.1 hypothetical protein LOZ60_005054 [Ophidiomyces ophidiicola]KAI1937138.1 hypothetical protein LOZ66_004055 [Ophidiomyces ophidiicola]